MSVAGIIAEYNPFHEGHYYHMKKARRITGASACVCVLSSNFVQRGEPAIVDKWARTRMALSLGADLVIELPCAFSCASAEYFASAAVKILDSLNCVDYLCFGSEEGSLESIERTAGLLAFESDDFKRELKRALDQGLSFAAARQKALKNGAVLDKPNNILGVEYIKAIRKTGSPIKPVTVGRIGQDYNGREPAGSFLSAAAIRRHLSETFSSGIDLADLEKDPFLKNNLPEKSLNILTEEFGTGKGPVFPESFETLLLYLLRRSTEAELRRLPYVNEGLEHRIRLAAMNSSSVSGFVSQTVTSRYPASRIRRILCALLTGMTKELLDELKSGGYAQYIRILGFNETGRKLLPTIKRKARLPIITKPAGYTRLDNPLARRLFEYEIRAADAYALGYPEAGNRLGGTEYRTRPVYMKEK